MDADPIKRSLDEIEQELEAAISNLNATNQRVDDLLNEYSEGDTPVRPQTADVEELSAPEVEAGPDEAPPEY